MPGIITAEGVNVTPLDSMWDAVAQVPARQRVREALDYTGVQFFDEDRNFVDADSMSVSLVALGGVMLAHMGDTELQVADRLRSGVAGSREVMGSSANFSYLSGKSPEAAFQQVVDLGHFSVAHTVTANILVAGISEAAELELSLQRDLVHLSKLTNARTMVQDFPPIVVHDAADVPLIRPVYNAIVEAAVALRHAHPGKDGRELANTIFPTSKATLLMISGTLRNINKLTDFKDDDGKEYEFRNLARKIRSTMGVLWPEIFTGDDQTADEQGTRNGAN
jgi:hypothetical protein